MHQYEHLDVLRMQSLVFHLHKTFSFRCPPRKQGMHTSSNIGALLIQKNCEKKMTKGDAQSLSLVSGILVRPGHDNGKGAILAAAYSRHRWLMHASLAACLPLSSLQLAPRTVEWHGMLTGSPNTFQWKHISAGRIWGQWTCWTPTASPEDRDSHPAKNAGDYVSIHSTLVFLNDA
jgi:hypothetical protein